MCRLILFIRIKEKTHVIEGIFRVREINPALRGMIINSLPLGMVINPPLLGMNIYHISLWLLIKIKSIDIRQAERQNNTEQTLLKTLLYAFADFGKAPFAVFLLILSALCFSTIIDQ